MINNKRYSLYVHHEKQVVQVNHPSQMPARKLLDNAVLIDSLLRMNMSTATVSKAENGLYVITAIYPTEVQKLGYRIFYSPESFTIRKVEINTENPADVGDGVQTPVKERVVITYEKMDKQIAQEETVFSEDRFIQKKRRTLELTNEFREYQLLNLIP